MNLSYWEKEEWFTNVDFTIVGSGIVGLNTALTIASKYPKAKILVLEKGMLPQGASTKNAGFTCFGSLSEIISDFESHTENEVFELVEKRWEGLKMLRNNLGDKNIDYQNNGSYELFLPETNLLKICSDKLNYINSFLRPIFKTDVFSLSQNTFGFKNVKEQLIFNQFEGQIDTGKMMTKLLQLVHSKGIKVVNNISVESFSDSDNSVQIKTNRVNFSTSKLLIATNGFASQLLNEAVLPARAQVLITKPIDNLHIKGTFHLDEGHYYFRNINNRILFGGGRNLNFKAEETTEMNTTELVQNKLREILKTTILPNTSFEIEYSWTGIMGIGNQKKAIIKEVSNNVFCGVRLGGMGIAIGSYVGKELGRLV